MAQKKATTAKKKTTATSKYFEAVGRRKTAIARVRLFKGNGKVSVNDQPIDKYFSLGRFQKTANAPLGELNVLGELDATVKVKGGGSAAQAGAVRHGIARALVSFNPDFKKRLRSLGFLTRDPRMVERKKYGLKKARRAPQWSKR